MGCYEYKSLRPLSELGPGQKSAAVVRDLPTSARQRQFSPAGRRLNDFLLPHVVAYRSGSAHRLVSHGASCIQPHVPLKIEAEPAEKRRPRYNRPRGGFLGNHHGIGKSGIHLFVQFPQELKGVDVLFASIPIGYPLPVRRP